ncbi:MAG TPA: citrate lyase subunit alpha [Spirochaetales bacterium]|nr:citrate lyase subunit alpha [Spirochaetales bacterium]HRY55501.1 citrate lyase subunit alpha [Spirochaetia bacterium]
MKLDMTQNSLGRLVPRGAPGLGELAPFAGAYARLDGTYEWTPRAFPRRVPAPSSDKVAPSLEETIRRSGLDSGMTVSFHHHLRNGDAVVDLVLGAAERLGIRNLTLAPSSLGDSHDCVAEYLRRGVVTRLNTSGVRGEVGKAISQGRFEAPVVIRSHGGRARAIEEGSLRIDVAFLAAPACDRLGNMTGSSGKTACGSLGYAMHDARYAGHVVAVTDNLVPYPLAPRISVPQHLVDQVAVVDSIGDPSRIATGATRISRDPVQLRIAELAFGLVRASGLLVEGCSFQTGGGGPSLAVARYVRDYMKEKGVKGSYCIGGITGYMADMLKEGLFDALFDVQSFDAAVTGSIAGNPRHLEVDVSCYANPFNKGCLVNDLDIVALAALDVDVDFNVDVLTGHDGVLRGASGGHSDTAAGAKLAIITVPSMRNGVPSIRERVQTAVTPGETVDAIVTERGMAINPRREDLARAARAAGLPVKGIRELKAEIERVTGVPDEVRFSDEVVGIVEYRDGTIIDSIRRVD